LMLSKKPAAKDSTKSHAGHQTNLLPGPEMRMTWATSPVEAVPSALRPRKAPLARALQVDHAAGRSVEMARFGYALSVKTCASMGA